jgi:DnaK suppressor protein
MEALAYDTQPTDRHGQHEEADAAGDALHLSVPPELHEPFAVLVERREELRTQLEALARDDDDTARPHFSNHLAEDAQDQQQRQGEVAMGRLLLQEVQQVDYALQRAACGLYGVCEDCGRTIPPRRLHIIPAATLCVTCQEQREGQRKVH